MAPSKCSTKSQAELDAIKKAVTPEERFRIVEQRKRLAGTYSKKITIGTNLTEGSPAFSLFQEASLFYGTPINARLDDNMRVVYEETSEGAIKWRSDESIGGAETQKALRCVIETLFEEKNESLLAQVVDALKASKLFKATAKDNAVDLIERIMGYRRRVAAEKADERLENIKDSLKALPPDQVRQFLEELQIRAQE